MGCFGRGLGAGEVYEYVRQGQPTLQFAAAVGADRDFLQFASSASEASVVDYWRGLLAELEDRRGLTAYHLEVLPAHPTPRRAQDATWCVTVVYDTAQRDEQRAGPIAATQCMSCELDCPLSVGVGSGETQLTSRDTAVAEYAHHRAWLDAKARTMLVLTPNRHVRRLAQLSDEELAEFWRNAAQLLHAEGLTQWDRMVLNHGDFQNHAHLHLKIRVPQRHWSQAVEQWPPARRALWSRLEEYKTTLETRPEQQPRRGLRQRAATDYNDHKDHTDGRVAW